MKPSIEEVLQKIIDMNIKAMHNGVMIPVTTLIEELDTCSENIMPCLLQLAREKQIMFSDYKRNDVVLLPPGTAA